MNCPHCHSLQPSNNKFCGECGKNLNDGDTTLLYEEDRRHVTVLFADLVDSSRLVRQLDPEQWQRVLTVYKEISHHIVHDFNGHVVEFQGDGLVARFDSHELSTESAIRAAVDLIHEVQQLRPVGPAEKTTQLQLRIGIASGEAIVVEPNSQIQTPIPRLHGLPPYIASRLQSVACPNEIIISDACYQLVKSHFSFNPVEDLDLKGFDDINQAWRLLCVNDGSIRFDLTNKNNITPLVGRKETMAALHHRWKRCQLGEGQVVFLNGEAGIGKSRIVSELQRSMNRFSQPSIVLRYQCSPFAKDIPLMPVTQQFTIAAGINNSDSEQVIIEKIDTLLGGWNVDVTFYRNLLLPIFLNQSTNKDHPEPQQRDIDKAIRACTLLPFLFTRRCPVLVVIEDMHWADSASTELLRRSIIKAKKFPIMIIVAARPEYKPPFYKDDYVTEMKIKRLSQRAAEKLLNRVHISHSFPTSVVQSILDKSEGIPLFIEEMALHLNRTDQQSGMQLPATLFDTLIEHFSRLPQNAKRVARGAAVIGDSFEVELLSTMLNYKPATIKSALHIITQEEVCYPSNDTKKHYIFFHALMRDAIYETILNKQKYDLHQSMVKHIEKQASDTSPLLAQRLGYHQKMINRYKPYVD